MLPAKVNAILEEKYCKKDMIRFFCSGNSEIVFALMTKVIASHIIITSINVRKADLE